MNNSSLDTVGLVGLKMKTEMGRLKICSNLNYSRAGVGMSLLRPRRIVTGRRIAAGFVLGALAATACAQYPGLVTKTDKSQPVLRSVAVLEWTGEAGKPSASRLVPVAIYDGEQLNDATIYLTRPEPLALAGGTEYELQTAGKPSGLFDVFSAGEFHDSWFGFGAWKPLSAAAAAKAAGAFNTSSLLNPVDAAEDDKPVLKRKHPKDADTDDASTKAPSATSGTNSGIGSTGDTKKAQDTSADPDRPALKRKSSDDSATTTASTSGSKSTADADPDRPTIRKKKNVVDAGQMETSTIAPDPDRPRLKRGKPADLVNTEDPRLTGLPPTMQQAVAVSDANNRAEHPWKYTWANPEDETKMKVALEGMARTALGLDTPPAPAKPVRKATTPRKKSMLPAAPPEPVALVDEQFRVFELAYGATATLVLTASSPKPPDVPDVTQADTDKPPAIHRGKPTATTAKQDTSTKLPPKPVPQKFVTLVAQPDLYGGVLVLYKSVTDSAHLDENPRMRLVDAVDAMGDNRGELLFELRGQTQRQFALFRVLRGSAERLFATVALP
jgi:hypothetical protein